MYGDTGGILDVAVAIQENTQNILTLLTPVSIQHVHKW